MWKALENERRFGTHLKVRRWKYTEAHELSGPVAVHPAVEVAWAEEGGARYQIGSRTHDVAKGQVMVVPAGVEHATRITGHSRLGSIWIGAESVADLGDALGRKHGGL
jgi:mannose-6-phosphate isomerase-like protein (cupin superfamily)